MGWGKGEEWGDGVTLRKGIGKAMGVLRLGVQQVIVPLEGGGMQSWK